MAAENIAYNAMNETPDRFTPKLVHKFIFAVKNYLKYYKFTFSNKLTCKSDQTFQNR